MSTATYARPLYAVPNVPPSTKARFASLLALRDAAYRAFDKALSVSGSALGWVLSQLHRWVEATGGLGVLSWVSDHARDAVGLIRTAGIVPSVLAVLSTPRIAATAGRVAKFVGRGLLRVASAAWTGLKGLLNRCGNTGTRVVEGLARAGTYVADAVTTVAQHPMMAPLAQAAKATIALVRPVSWVLVTHRLLGALVPIVWLRAVVELLVMPFLVDSTLAGNVRECVTTSPAETDANGADDATASTGLLTVAGVIAAPTTGITLVSDDDEEDDQEQVEEDEPLNRASRRAQQREDAHAWRMQHPHK